LLHSYCYNLLIKVLIFKYSTGSLIRRNSSLIRKNFNLIKKSALEITPCPVCRSSDMSVLHIFSPFKVVLCKDCQLIYLNPRLKESDARKMYQGNEYFLDKGNSGYQDYNYLSQERSLRLTFRKFLGELEKHGMTSGRLLEIGCGYGYFLDEAKQYFSYTAGTELSEEAANYARRLSGADIYLGDISSLPNKLSNFNIIVAINVIEHVYNPVEFLLSLKERLINGGIIVIATPDIGSIWYKIMKSKWPSFKIPEHVVFYTKSTLISLLERAGFLDIMRIPFPHAFPFGLMISKLGININRAVCQKPIWLPRTMIALAARTT
jgi:SAM-dependent methyltransferase